MMIDLLNDWFIWWMFDWYIWWVNEWMNESLVEWFIGWIIDRLAEWMIDWFGDCNAHLIGLIPSDARLFPCPECSKSFAQKSDLAAHSRVHSPKSKPTISCEDCGKEYHHSHGLKQHRLTDHSDSTKKPFQCDECDKSFVRSNDLTRHKTIHSGIKPFQVYIRHFKFSLNVWRICWPICF